MATVQQVNPKELDQPRQPGERGGHSGRRLSTAELLRTEQLVDEMGPTKAGQMLGLSTAGVGDRIKALDKRRREDAIHDRSDRQVDSTHAATVEIPVTASDQQVDEPRPVVALIQHLDGEERAKAFNEGYEQAMQDAVTPGAIEALIEWLVRIAPTWTQAEAERWLKAFTATIDLVYPTRPE